MAPRLRRVEMAARNRETVLAAARRVFIDRGYTGATLEAIAEEAGFSTGVMYSQFESKADLFLTLLEQRIEERTGQAERISAEYAGLEGLNRLLEAGGEDAVAEAAWTRVLVEFREFTGLGQHGWAIYCAATGLAAPVWSSRRWRRPPRSRSRSQPESATNTPR